LNRVFSSFDPFNNKFSPRDRLIDIFPSHFSFHSTNRKNKESIKVHICKLDEIIFQVSLDSKTALDASIKNQVTTFIVHVHTYNSLVIKMIHYVINIILTKAKLFAIRYSINQATCLFNINWIIVIMDSIHAVKRIFDLLNYLYQIQLLLISKKLRDFFIKDYSNFIEFWNCPSHENWTFYNLVNKETKNFDLILMFSYKFSWNFDKKHEYNKILNE